MNTLPLSLNLEGQPCLIVGGGNVASRKIQVLAEAGAKLIEKSGVKLQDLYL